MADIFTFTGIKVSEVLAACKHVILLYQLNLLSIMHALLYAFSSWLLMQNSCTIEDRVLLINACRGCRGSLSAIYSKYKKAVSDYLKRAGTDRHSEDITHNVFIAILDGKCKYDGSGDVKTYLFGIARNICTQDIKQLYGITYDHRVAVVSTQIMASPVAAVEQLELRRDFEAAMAVLPPKPRQAIQLVYFEGKTHKEAAKELGCDYMTVYLRIRYGLKRLGEIFTDNRYSLPCKDLCQADEIFSKNTNFL